jgi:acetyltransferase-like isoleucine patch superfamily enzyme
VKGPGTVLIGNNVRINGTSHAVTPWTYDRNAIISIGNNVFLNGTRFGCRQKIDIGDDCIVADCRILDTDHHSIMPYRRNDPVAIKSAPIRVGTNVWLAMDCVVLKGVEIGENTTITAKSVVVSNCMANCIYAGNPARLVRELSEAEMVKYT